MSDAAFKFWIERVLGHFVVLGVVLGAALGPLAIPVYLVREFTQLRIGRWKIGQWPPGDTLTLATGPEVDGMVRYEDWAPLDRVKDLRADLVECCTGWGAGYLIHRTVTLPWLAEVLR